MKVFEGKGDWTSKINFVDENNVMLGYDMSQDCCEHAEWFIADSIQTKMPTHRCNDGGLEDYRFVPDFFESPNELQYEDMEGDALDSGGMVVFKITDGTNDKFIHLFNCHNGYYGHGFEFKIGDKMEQEGCL